MASREVDEFQSLILENAFRIAKTTAPESRLVDADSLQILSWIAAQDPIGLTDIMGNFGHVLNKFCNKIDLKHPYLAQMFMECNIGIKQLSLIKEVCTVAPYLKENSLYAVTGLIRSQFQKFKEVTKEFSNKISRPPVRLLRDLEDRKVARKSKKSPKVISYSSALEKLYCEHLPSNFKSYFCGYNYQDELDAQQVMYDSFLDVKADDYAKYVLNGMEQIKRKVSDQYYGFVRLKPCDAVLPMAKSMGLSWRPGSKCIQVPRSMFSAKDVFWSNDGITDLPNLKYHPNYYPLHTFKVPMPDRTSKIIDLLEKYPVVGERPIFDHYWIVCPSFHLDAKEFSSNSKYRNKWKIKVKGEWVIVDWNYDVAEAGAVNEAVMLLDFSFTESGFVTPIVLGERSGECFFICYWV